MPVNKFHLILLVLLVLGSCIEPFEPAIEDNQNKLVINGMVSDKPGFYYVTVSESAPYNSPDLIPVPGCVITVEDNLGELRVYQEQAPGLYEANLDQSFLEIGKSYSLYLLTPSGSEYRSQYDTLLLCPPVDSIYYEQQSQATADPDLTYYGLQFYNDLKGIEQGARSFRWILYETWEYNSPYEADVIFDGRGYDFYPGYEISKCYMTQRIRNLYTASTRTLLENRLNRNALNYVSNQSPRLSFKYSLLVEQQSLTNSTYDYWEKMKTSSSEGGGLYETQPSSTIGNIYNINNPGEKVLGCFYATQMREKRIIVERGGFDFDVGRFRCEIDTIYSLGELKTEFPNYGISIGEISPSPPWLVGSKQCFDCQLYGGTVSKPEYW